MVQADYGSTFKSLGMHFDPKVYSFIVYSFHT